MAFSKRAFRSKWILNRQLTPIAVHPASTCEALIATAKRSLHNDTGVLLRQTAYILTWFVTSSVVGLYVVMPCVPTEKTRLYLEHKDESETHPTPQQHLQQHTQSHWISIQCRTNAGYMAPIKHVGVSWSKILCGQKTFYEVLILRLFKTSKISYSIVMWEEQTRISFRSLLHPFASSLWFSDKWHHQALNWWFQTHFSAKFTRNLYEEMTEKQHVQDEKMQRKLQKLKFLQLHLQTLHGERWQALFITSTDK